MACGETYVYMAADDNKVTLNLESNPVNGQDPPEGMANPIDCIGGKGGARGLHNSLFSVGL